MKVVLAPDKFKGSLTAKEVCQAMKSGIARFNPSIEVIAHPLADGGEGSLTVIDEAFQLTTVFLNVQGPKRETVKAHYKVSSDSAYIEMALASGLELIKKPERNCMYTSTFGTGQMIKHAINAGYRKIYLLIGGSATNDAGVGLATALGYQFFDDKGAIINPVGKDLVRISSIVDKDLMEGVKSTSFTVITDVKNLLYGENGAAHTYAAQKGATAEDIKLLDQGLKNFSRLVENTFKISVAGLVGGGAAGGLGAGMVALFQANIKPGIDTIMNITNFETTIKDVDLIITGEGKLDLQSMEGKVVEGVCRTGNQHQIPTGIICGTAENLAQVNAQISPFAIRQLVSENVGIEESIKNASQLIARECELMLYDFNQQ